MFFFAFYKWVHESVNYVSSVDARKWVTRNAYAVYTPNYNLYIIIRPQIRVIEPLSVVYFRVERHRINKVCRFMCCLASMGCNSANKCYGSPDTNDCVSAHTI